MENITLTPEQLENRLAKAREDERNRIKDLDSIPVHNEEARKLINKAKFEEPKAVEKVALEIVNLDSYKAKKEIDALQNEHEESGANQVKGMEMGNKTEMDAERDTDLTNKLIERLNKRRGL